MTDPKEILDIPQHLRRDNVGDDVQAMLNAVNVMESQSVLITKLQQELAESDDAVHQAQWRFEQAEKQLDAVREILRDENLPMYWTRQLKQALEQDDA